jgi:beta-lactamase class A
MMDLAAAQRGDENVSTAGELRRLAELLHEAPGLSPERAKDLLAVAALPKSSPFREVLPEGLTVADKPGELEGVRAACAFVDLPGRPYTIGIMSGYLHRDADGDQAIREISAAVFQTFDRLARSSPYGRIISER